MDYRYNQAREWQDKLKSIVDTYMIKVKKYHRRVIVIDIIVYAVSAVVAGAVLVLSAVTMTSPVVITICVSASTTIAGVFNIIANKISTCTNEKLSDYAVKLHAATASYSKLSQLISEGLNDASISDSEFALMTKIFSEAMTVIEATAIKVTDK